MSRCCFQNGCELEVQYICLCSSFETFCCEFHLEAHLKLPNRTHIFDSVFTEPSEGTKEAILQFLTKAKSRKQKLKQIALDSLFHNRYSSKNSFAKNVSELESDLNKISSLIEKISKISRNEKELQLLNQANLQPGVDLETTTMALPNEIELNSNSKEFYRLEWIRNKRIEILNRAYSSSKAEEDFRNTCLLYKNSVSESSLIQASQKYIDNHQKINFLIEPCLGNPNLYIYDTITEREEIKNLEIQVKRIRYNCIVQIPNGELFLTCYKCRSSVSYIIDRNYQARILSFKIPARCLKAVYYNGSVFCLAFNYYTFSFVRIDLDWNRWSRRTSMNKSHHIDHWLIILFNGNILISRETKCNILLYSIDIDSFSEIPYNFAQYTSKILINAEDRLYLIECSNGSKIYESEMLNEYYWKAIANQKIISFNPEQVYFSYNKSEIYISVTENKDLREHFKFDLNKKVLIEVACISQHFALKRTDNGLEAIEFYNKNFVLDGDHASIYINKGYSLYYIVNRLEKIAYYSKETKSNRTYTKNYFKKALNLRLLKRNQEAIECYNELIRFNPECKDAYIQKANLLKDKCHRYLEALQCINELIKLYPMHLEAYLVKAKILHCLGRKLEEIECYKEVIKLDNKWWLAYYKTGKVLHNLGRTIEAIDFYSKAIMLNPIYIKTYLRKAGSLYYLGNKLEAKECLSKAFDRKPIYIGAYWEKADILKYFDQNDEAIKFYSKLSELCPRNYLYLSYRAYLLSHLGQETAAIKDFNKAYDLMSSSSNSSNEILNPEILKLLKMLSKLVESTVKFKKEIQKLKKISLKNQEMFQEVENAESEARKEYLRILEVAVGYLKPNENKPIEAIQEIQTEISKYQKAIVDIVPQLSLLKFVYGKEVYRNP